jgi:RNA polymerase sigma factor (sigma-70 family)
MITSRMLPEPSIIIWNSFKKGEWDAYTRLYDFYYRPLNNYGHKFTKDVSLIEDAIHDLFVKLWTNRENLGEPVSIKNYLYKALRNILIRKIKSASRFSIFDSDVHSYPFEISFDDVIIRNEEEKIMQQTIKTVLNNLPSRQKEIVYLRFYEGLSYEEIAEVMAIDINSVYKLWYKTIENLKEQLPRFVLFFFLSACCAFSHTKVS